ncbi:RICIN domain-containing protein [Streptomyces sp. NPDC050703]|uniref:RICIN domain-containing protein n=1 Tax=Streptomyces sp. NPDC050703 TaxID=3157218 RepID=UPI003430F4A5
MGQKGDGLAAPPEESPQPARARTSAEFTAALRTLRLWSGLTYRQLEGKATAHSDTLPASTIATTLGRVTLPREQFVDAFTRACGLGEEEARQWLEARRRIATADPVPLGDEGTAKDEAPKDEAPGGTASGSDVLKGETGGPGDQGDGHGDGPAAPASDTTGRARTAARWRRMAGLLGAALIGVLGTLGASSVLRDASEPAALPTMPVTGLRMLAVGSWAQIHPARTPELCLTEGRDRTGRYETAVAAQRRCGKSGSPQLYLEPVGRDTVQIQWHHPKYGIGCLTVLPSGPGRDLLEPRDDCAEDNRAQQFRIERFGPPSTGHFRIRPVGSGHCLSLRHQDTHDGAEIIQGRCSGAADQDFRIELTPPPQTAAGSTPPSRR